MASPNTLKLRSERLYDKKGHPTKVLLQHKMREQRTAAWRKRNPERAAEMDRQASGLKAAREIETGVKDARSATA